jgi:carbonic anhydrase
LRYPHFGHLIGHLIGHLKEQRDMENERNASRRDMLKLAAAGIAGFAGASIASADALPREQPGGTSPETPRSKPETPEAALQMLLEGNRRYVAQQLLSLHDDFAALRQQTENKQEPFAAVLSCSDSRVPAELIFDQSIGHLFVARVAGNIATPDTIASLEYGAAVLGVKVIMVLGHTNCGAVKATIAGKAVPGQIGLLFQYIQPAIEKANGDAESGTRMNALFQASLLREASPLLAEMAAQKKLLIQPALYELSTGRVTLLSA